jgi:hypothetical protein
LRAVHFTLAALILISNRRSIDATCLKKVS